MMKFIPNELPGSTDTGWGELQEEQAHGAAVGAASEAMVYASDGVWGRRDDGGVPAASGAATKTRVLGSQGEG